MGLSSYQANALQFLAPIQGFLYSIAAISVDNVNLCVTVPPIERHWFSTDISGRG